MLNQSAQDTGRYEFVKDIQRLTQIVSARNEVVGHAIMLTNDSLYWKPPKHNRTVDASFRIHHEKIIRGELGWRAGASKGTMQSREEPIIIESAYTLRWQDYSEQSKESYGKFRYLFVTVNSGHGA